MFSSKLLTAMQSRNCSNKDLSRKTGISQSDISRIASGDKMPGLEGTERIAQALQLPLCYFTNSQSSCSGLVDNSKKIHITRFGMVEISRVNPITKNFSFMLFCYRECRTTHLERFLHHDFKRSVMVLRVVKGQLRLMNNNNDIVMNEGDVEVIDDSYISGGILRGIFSQGATVKAVIIGEYRQSKRCLEEYINEYMVEDDNPSLVSASSIDRAMYQG